MSLMCWTDSHRRLTSVLGEAGTTEKVAERRQQDATAGLLLIELESVRNEASVRPTTTPNDKKPS